MALVGLTLDTLAELDNGKVALLFQAALSRIQEDLRDRPADTTARKLTVTVNAKPGEVSPLGLQTTQIEVEVKAAVPVHRTRAYQCNVGEKGGMLFNVESPDDPNQMTIDDEIPHNS